VENKEVNKAPPQTLTPTMEDYLEAIFDLSKEKRVVRVKNIARRLGVKMPSVTSMLKTLSKRGFVDYEKYEYLELAEKGVAVGKEIHRRHQALRSFLIDILKVDFKKADEEACKMEHALGPSTLDRLLEFMEFVQVCPRAGVNWLGLFDEYRRHGQKREKCLSRMKEFASGFGDRIKTMEEIKKKNDGV